MVVMMKSELKETLRDFTFFQHLISSHALCICVCFTHCLRVAGRKPTISMASWSLSKSCFRSSPSTVKQSCRTESSNQEGVIRLTTAVNTSPAAKRTNDRPLWSLEGLTENCWHTQRPNVFLVYRVFSKDAWNSFGVYSAAETKSSRVARSTQDEMTHTKISYH